MDRLILIANGRRLWCTQTTFPRFRSCWKKLLGCHFVTPRLLSPGAVRPPLSYATAKDFTPGSEDYTITRVLHYIHHHSHNEQTYRITQIRGIEVLHIEQCRPPVSLLPVNSWVQLIPEWTISNERQYTQPEQHHCYDRWTQPKYYKTYVFIIYTLH